MLIHTISYSSEVENGQILIESYQPQKHGAKNQVWGITQDHRGVMYFANSDGLVEFDGANWSVIEVEGEEAVRSIDIHNNGTIYLGSKGNFGYLKEDSRGNKRFVSLKSKMEESRRFGKVWQTHCTADGVFFVTNNEIFFWNDQELKTFNVKRSGNIQTIENQTIVNDRNQGLLAFNGESFEPFKGGEFFKTSHVFAVLPYDNRQWLLATKELGVVLMEKKTGEVMMPKTLGMINEYFSSKNLHKGIALENEKCLFTTLNGGAIVTNKEFKIERILDKKLTITDETIWSAYIDKEANIWLGSNDGVFKVEINSPINFWDNPLGLQRNIKDIVRHNDLIYTATDRGVYVQKNGNFHSVSHLNVPVHKLIIFEDPYTKKEILLAATNKGLYHIDRFKGRPIEPNCGPVDAMHVALTDILMMYMLKTMVIYG